MYSDFCRVFRNKSILGHVEFRAAGGPSIKHNGGFRPLASKQIAQSTSILVDTLVGLVFRTDSLLGMLPDFGPLVAKEKLKMAEDWKTGKLFTRPNWKLCVLIWWFFRNDSLWGHAGPTSALQLPKMTENGGFRPALGKLFTKSNWNLVCTLIGWVVRNHLILGHVSQFGPIVTRKQLKTVVSHHYLKTNHSIHFSLGVYSYLVWL